MTPPDRRSMLARSLAWGVAAAFWLDGLLTWAALSTVPGLREANPLGAIFLGHGVIGMIALKAWASLYAVAVGYLVRPRRAVPALTATLIAYLAIIVWNLRQMLPLG
ncbi:MAG TPA: DUF5658 family protein [Dehalococcoidia bacterium]|nr:DUF5658 family protein [Dehalococcoidia bacterium]